MGNVNILITGANGFIGRALCNKLIADGYHVRGSVRGAAQMTALPSGVEGAMVGDIGPETDWSEALDGIEGIVHLAARVHVMRESSADPLAAFREVNVEGTKRLARQAAEAGVKRLVYISSVKVNGERTGKREDGGRKRETGRKRDERPTSNIEPPTSNEKQKKQKSEARGLGSVPKEVFSENDVPEPRDPYAVSKLEAEHVLNDIGKKRGLEIVILRPPLVYGPGVRANFLRLVKLVRLGVPLPFGCVKNRRSLIYVGNLVDAIVACVTNPNAVGETYLVSDGENISTPELIRRIAYSFRKPARLFSVPVGLLKAMGKITGRSAEVERVVGSLCVDSGKIRRELGWKPPFTMEEGLKRMEEVKRRTETGK